MKKKRKKKKRKKNRGRIENRIVKNENKLLWLKKHSHIKMQTFAFYCVYN